MAERTGIDADERLRRIESVTDAALAHLDVEDLLVELLERTRELLGVDTAAVLTVDPSGQQLVPIAAVGVEEVRQGIRIPVGRGFAGTIVAERRARILDRVDATTVFNPVLWQTGIQSLLGVPMVSAGAVIGVLHVGTLRPHQFTSEEADLLQLVADRIALATQSQVTRAERAAATALQRSLLPTGLPEIEGFELATRYVPGVGEVGGDWYDVFPLPSGNLAVVIGDVVGRGLRAAVVMGRLRSALRAYAVEFDDPAVVLTKLDNATQHFESDIMATVVYGVIEPTYGRMRLSSAGHPPPVIAMPGAFKATILDAIGDLPIGVQPEHHRRVIEVDLRPGALLCLYTDGLVERRNRSLAGALDRLCEAAVPGPAETICSAIMTKVLGEEPIDDDVTLVAIRRRPDEPAEP